MTAQVAHASARRARTLGGAIAYVERERPPIVLAKRDPKLPARWSGFGNFPEAVVSGGPANIHRPLRIPWTGRYNAWIEGSYARRMAIYVDGERLPLVPSGLNNPGAYVSLGGVRLQRGAHDVLIRQGGGDLRPGSGGFLSSLRHVGPLFFDPAANASLRVRTIGPRDWRSLVGVRADWLEIVSRAQR